MYDVEKLDATSEDVKEYIESSLEKTPRFMERYREYKLDEEIVTKLKCHSSKYKIYAFSAEWCPDCYRNIPVLAHIQEEIGIKVRIFGHLMRDAENPNKRWKIPPSPAEVDLFDVVKIPSMYVFDEDGNKVGEVIENPPEGKTLDETILNILES
jgi:thiol-disulfide isomerase/thioredoxin